MAVMNKEDRCDRCGAEAVHRFVRKDEPGHDLMFCNHHTTEYLPALTRQFFVAVESKELVGVR